jgi:hypothetical protein
MSGLFEQILMRDSKKEGNTGTSFYSRKNTILTISRRGKSGGQVRDEYRDEYDPGRGGYGRALEEKDNRVRY